MAALADWHEFSVAMLGGVLLLFADPSGLVWLAADAIAAIVAALFVSWVVLVEVLR